MLGAVRSARVARPRSQRSVVMKVGFAQYAVGQLLLAPLVVWVVNVGPSLSVNGGLR
jgi:hypothetical protein